MNSNIIKLSCLFSALLSTMLCALPEDKQHPVHLQAERIAINQRTHQTTFSNNVRIDQGSTHLRATQASALIDEHHQLQLAVAEGDHKTQAHAWTTLTLNKPDVHAWADVIRYYPRTERLILLGHARLMQEPNTFLAPKITYDMKNHHVITSTLGRERTHIVIERPSHL